jgi:polysaccharide export outer membrane protein
MRGVYPTAEEKGDTRMRYLQSATVSALMMTAVAVKSQSTIASAAASDAPAVSSTTPSSAPALERRGARYRLRKGDTFDIDFAYSPEFNQTLAVQPDGYVTLKEAGSIYVEGKTVPELTETIKAAYSETLHAPVIAIDLKDFEKPYFIAGGEVSKPGKYDLRGKLTVTEAVAIAGGFNDRSKHSQVVLFHPLESGGYEAKLLNIKQLLATRNLAEDPILQPGDMLYVPQNTISKIKPYLPVPSFGAAALF